jgi:hypothetical protein
MHKKKFCDLCILPVDIFRGKGYYSHNDTGIVNEKHETPVRKGTIILNKRDTFKQADARG